MRSDLGKTICILISGKAGVGKTLSSNIIKKIFTDREYSTEIFNFACGVKTVAKYMGWDGKKDPTGRKLLQDIGAVGREYDPDCWVGMTFNKLIPESPGHPYDVILVDNYRFPNESDYARKQKQYQVFEIRVSSPEREILKGTSAYKDISETSLPEYNEHNNSRYFSVVYNNGSIEQLSEVLEELVDVIETKAIRW
jgi:hypothetical protein